MSDDARTPEQQARDAVVAALKSIRMEMFRSGKAHQERLAKLGRAFNDAMPCLTFSAGQTCRGLFADKAHWCETCTAKAEQQEA
jgi:hypothetical protein